MGSAMTNPYRRRRLRHVVWTASGAVAWLLIYWILTGEW